MLKMLGKFPGKDKVRQALEYVEKAENTDLISTTYQNATKTNFRRRHDLQNSTFPAHSRVRLKQWTIIHTYSYSYCTRELPTTITVWMPLRKPRLNLIFTNFVHRFFQDLILRSHSFQTPRLTSSPRMYPHGMNVATSAGHILYSLCLRSLLLRFLSLQCVLCKGNT